MSTDPIIQRRRHDSDTPVIDRARAGDVDAFGILYGRHRQRIYNFCLQMTNDAFLSEDLLQESFLCAFRRIHTFRGDSLFSTWLYRIAINVVLMQFRRRKTSPTENVDPVLASCEPDVLDEERFSVVDTRLNLAVERVALEQAIDSLPPGYRMMLVLHDIEGFEHWEIAHILGCTTGNSKSQLFKARRRLRQLVMRSNEDADKHIERVAA
jgi:RNA polymerase sigma-70 factor, ECF subfamily